MLLGLHVVVLSGRVGRLLPVVLRGGAYRALAVVVVLPLVTLSLLLGTGVWLFPWLCWPRLAARTQFGQRERREPLSVA